MADGNVITGSVTADIRADLKQRFNFAAVSILDRWEPYGLQADGFTPVRQATPSENVAVDNIGKLLRSVDQVPEDLIEQLKKYDDVNGSGRFDIDVAEAIRFIEPYPEHAPESATAFVLRLLESYSRKSSKPQLRIV